MLVGVDTLHIVTEGPLGWTARIICSFKNWSFTSGFHTNFPEYIKLKFKIPTKFTYFIFRWFHKRSKAVMVPSKSTSDKLISKGFSNTVVWSRGYREDIFNVSRKRTDLLDGKINLLYVGRVSSEKNIEAFLDLDLPDCKLWVVGDGPDRVRLQELGKATFVGFKKGIELAEYFASADVFVFPSKTDTLGIVNIEAMACGTPVAAYNVEGPRDVVINGQGGCLSDNLKEAVINAQSLIGSSSILENAKKNTWNRACDIFYSNLVSVK
jgi:glycosyltransferase involved in cell wall biosynthesis